MHFQYTPYMIPLVLLALFSGWVMIYSWQRRSALNAAALSVMAFGILEWLIGYTLEISGADYSTKLFWGKMQYIGIVLTPLMWAVFAYYHTQQGKQLDRRNITLLFLIPLITNLLVFTNERHGLVWSTVQIERSGSFSALAVSHGLWFSVHLVYSYLLLLAGAVIIVRSLWRNMGLYRRQATALIIAVLAPWIGNALYLSGFSPIPHLDLTPFAFTITLAGLTWAIFGSQLVNISPIARDLIVDSMHEGMIVLDQRGSIVDINPAAGRMIGLAHSLAVGKRFEDAFTPWPSLIERLRSAADATDEISIGEGAAQRNYAVNIFSLLDHQNLQIGRIITLRALEAGAMPEPRYAVREPDTRPRVTLEQEAAPARKRSGLLGWLLDFIRTPVKTDLQTPPDMNPEWHQARERSFTLIMRVAALLGTVTLSITPFFIKLETGLPFAIIIALFWLLGVMRNVGFQRRAFVFLVLVYVLAFIEMYNYGYSVASFTFFLGLVVLATLLLGHFGGLITFLATLITISVFGVSISSGNFLPVHAYQGIPVPDTLANAITGMLAFTASTAALIVAVTILLGSLNKAWHLETQALNLLQQERDLLDQRVTERTAELAEARDLAVQSSNELRKYFRAIEQSGSTIVITDTQGNIEYVNPRFEQSTGYTLAEAIGKNPRILKSGRQPGEYYGELWKVISGGQVWKGEFLNKRKDNLLYWESATIAPVMDQAGCITHFVAIKDDITAQKVLQDQLQKQNDYLSILHQITLDLLNHRDLNNLLQVIVDRSAVLLDAPFSELMLEKDNMLVVEAFTANQPGLKGDCVPRAQASLSWQAFDTHQPVLCGDYATWADRRTIYDAQQLHATADFPVMAGERCLGVLALGRSQPGYAFAPEQVETGILFARLVALVLDNANLYESARREIAERKQAESLLLESEARFRQIVENASDIIYRTNTNGYFTYVNPTGLHTMGFSGEAEIIGKHYLELVLPSMHQELQQNLRSQLLNRTMNTYQEFIALTADGREMWIGQNVQLILNDNEIRGFQAVARDITQLKQAQEAIALSRDQALEASQLKTQLLSRVSHELRTPLSSVLGYAELFNAGSYGALNEEQKNIMKRISDSARYLSAIINDLLDEAQMSSKNITLHNEFFNPSTLLESMRARTTVLAQNKSLFLNSEIDPSLPERLYGDEKRLQQIIINLVGNAIKFTKSGGVHIRLSAPDSGRWAIQVTDTGSGIPEEDQRYIFDAFRQVDNTITRENRGTGLGLSIVKQLVEIMDGSIQLVSKVGEGSTFTILLPILTPRETLK